MYIYIYRWIYICICIYSWPLRRVLRVAVALPPLGNSSFGLL